MPSPEATPQEPEFNPEEIEALFDVDKELADTFRQSPEAVATLANLHTHIKPEKLSDVVRREFPGDDQQPTTLLQALLDNPGEALAMTDQMFDFEQANRPPTEQ